MFPCLCLWFRASSSFETNKHSNRYVNGADLTKNFDSKEYIHFSVAKFGVCHKSEKVNSLTSETTRICEVTDKYRGNDTVFLRRETDSYNPTMSGVYSKSKTSVLSLTKLIIGKLSKKEERHHINVFKLMALQTLPARAFLFNPHGYCIDEKKKKRKKKKK